MKFYFLHMKLDGAGTTLKHPESFHGNVKNLSKRMKMKDKGECHFYFNNLTFTIREHQGAPWEYSKRIVPHITVQNFKNKKQKKPRGTV